VSVWTKFAAVYLPALLMLAFAITQAAMDKQWRTFTVGLAAGFGLGLCLLVWVAP
jgi:hypothetical protein